MLNPFRPYFPDLRQFHPTLPSPESLTRFGLNSLDSVSTEEIHCKIPPWDRGDFFLINHLSRGQSSIFRSL